MNETPDVCPRCEESYYERMTPEMIARMTLYGDTVVCEDDGWLYFHDEHSNLNKET